jgi:hypothetical protein
MGWWVDCGSLHGATTPIFTPGESLMAAVSSDVALPVGGIILVSHPLVASWSLGENPVLLGRATAAPLASFPSWRRCLLGSHLAAEILAPCHGYFGGTTLSCCRQKGGCPPHVWSSGFLVGAEGSSCCCCFGCLQRTATGSIDAMVSEVQDNVDWRHLWHQQRGRLGSQRIAAGGFNIAGTTWCGTTSDDDASDFLGLLTRLWLLHARGSNEMNLVSSRASVLFQNYGGGASMLTSLTASSEWVRSGSCGGSVCPPCTRWSPTADAVRLPRVVSCLEPVFPLRREVLLWCSVTTTKGLA